MVTLYRNPALDGRTGSKGTDQTGYQGYMEPDTRVPPKARPVLSAISVNGVPIPEADILAEAQHHPAGEPGAALSAAASALVVRELCLQEARRLEIEAEPQFDGDGRQETPEEAAIRTLIDREIVVPSADEDECRRYYRNNSGRFRSQPVYMARHILLPALEADEAGRQQARAEAQRLIAHLQARPEDFPDLARRHSACPSREQDGNLGQISPGSTVPAFEAALEGMEENRLCPHPVETPFGCHIVFLDRMIPGEQLPFEAAKERIAGWLEAASWSRAVSQYIAILAARADIEGIDLGGADGPLVQ
jgi:peptidyl-prolyl cis-trans isomerase C